MIAHPIPDAALEADIATLAQKGAGKTYLNKGLVERLLSWKRRVIVMDPLNVWWGLQAMADGSPGFPVVVIGGPNADVPLDPSKGRELGAYCAGADIRAVIDVSELRAGQLVSFATAFFAELYRLNRDPLWLILEEADVFAPQNPQGNESFMLHEVDQIARRGRQRGFRLWTICQRPQELNKKALSQTSTMVLMRLRAPQDRKAAEAWMVGHGTKAQVADISSRLSSLATGEGYVWAPDHDILELVKFPPIATLDNSATPKAGDKRPSSIRLAKPDLKALTEILAAEIHEEPRKSGEIRQDPAELAAAEKRGFERGLALGEKRGMAQGMSIMLMRAQTALRDLQVDADGDAPASVASNQEAESGAAPRPTPAARAKPATAAPKQVGGDVSLTGPQRHLLGTLAWWAALGFDAVTRTQLAARAGWAPKGSTLRARLSELNSAQLVEYPQTGVVKLTEKGAAAAPAPDLSIGLVESIRAVLTGPQRQLFDALNEHLWPMTRAELAGLVGWEPSGSTLRARLSELHQLELVDYPTKGRVRLQPWVKEPEE